jgi:hypothetical protein
MKNVPPLEGTDKRIVVMLEWGHTSEHLRWHSSPLSFKTCTYQSDGTS